MPSWLGRPKKAERPPCRKGVRSSLRWPAVPATTPPRGARSTTASPPALKAGFLADLPGGTERVAGAQPVATAGHPLLEEQVINDAPVVAPRPLVVGCPTTDEAETVP